MKVIFIEWLDAALVSHVEWKNVDELEVKGCHMMSAGVLIREEPEGYFIAGDVDPEDANRARVISFIPRGMVKRKKVFKVT